MARPRAAADFAAIRARMEELQRVREQATRNHSIARADDAYRYPPSGGQEPAAKPDLRAVQRPWAVHEVSRGGR